MVKMAGSQPFATSTTPTPVYAVKLVQGNPMPTMPITAGIGENNQEASMIVIIVIVSLAIIISCGALVYCIWSERRELQRRRAEDQAAMNIQMQEFIRPGRGEQAERHDSHEENNSEH
jgi:hypothetical protein